MCRVVLTLMHALVIPSFGVRWSYNTILDTILTMFDTLVSLKSFPVGNVTSPLQTTNGGAISTKPKEFLWTKRRRAHQSCPLHQGRVQIVQGLLFFLDFFLTNVRVWTPGFCQTRRSSFCITKIHKRASKHI